MRKLTDHVVPGDSVNHQIVIQVLDEPGPGGANHKYEISHDAAFKPVEINFQNGAIKESGVNGLTQEALAAIVIDHLRSFQAGPFSCRENAIALTHFEEGLMWLQRRTAERIKRGVEGTTQK